MKLVIASKNYSSWSLRPWILLKVAGVPFEEALLRLDHYAGGTGAFPTEVRALGGPRTAGKVPILIERDGTAVWDSLAICERVAELHPDLDLWPRDAKARALARSVVAEMHSGFGDLRSNLFFNATSRFPVSIAESVIKQKPAVGADIARIFRIWGFLLEEFGGPFLFGKRFSVADAFYAPVVGRFVTYQIEAPSQRVQDYVERIFHLPAYEEWRMDAKAQMALGDWIPSFEPYAKSKL